MEMEILIKMAEVLPINFPLPSESSIASYDYTDIAEGTGVIKFGLFTTKNNSTTQYNVSANDFYSATIEDTASYGFMGSYYKALDLDFDLTPFNLPKIIKGTAIAEFSFWANTSAGGSTAVSKIGVRVRKVSGGVETDLGYEETQDTAASVGGSPQGAVGCVKIALTQTHFKIGDILRFTIEGYINNTAAGTGIVGFTHDPMDRDGTIIIPSTSSYSTKFRVAIPFKLDL